MSQPAPRPEAFERLETAMGYARVVGGLLGLFITYNLIAMSTKGRF